MKTFIINILKQPYIDKIFNNKIDYILFLVFLIRNISSHYCIIYGEKNNSYFMKIYQKNFKILILALKKNIKLDNSWINLIMNSNPQEILISNLHLFIIISIN